MRNPFDFDTSSASAADVDILSSRSDPNSDFSRAPVQETDVFGPFSDLIRIGKIRIGDRFDEGNTKPVGFICPHMGDIRNFAARILFQAQLDQPDFFILELDLSFDTENGCSLKSRGDTSIQILFSSDVDLTDDIEFTEQCNLKGNVQCFSVDGEWRSIVDFIGTGCPVFDFVDNCLSGFELHKRGTVVFPELTEGGTHVPDDFGIDIIIVVINSGWAVTKEFLFCFQLLMNFQSGLETNPVVIRLLGIRAQNITHVFFCFVIIG
jgi:hypothetical protein